MHNLFLLLKLNLDEELRISAHHYEKEKSKRKAVYVQRTVAFLCLICVIILFYQLGQTMVSHQMEDAIPVFSYVIGSIVTLILTILKITEILSGKEDAEYQMSLPISSFLYVICIFLRLYIWNTLVVFLTGFPMLIAYIQSGKCSSVFVPYWIIGVLITYLPIIGIASLLSTFLALLIAPKKNNNQIHAVLTLIILTGIFLLILKFTTEIHNITISLNTYGNRDTATQFIDTICKNYKLGRFYQYGIVQQNALWTFLFILISVIWNVFFILFLSVAYQIVIISLKEPYTYGSFTFGPQKQMNLKRTLFHRELTFYLHSRSYASNTLPGVIFAILFSLYTFIYGPQIFFGLLTGNAVPFFLSALIGASNTTYCSFSMEGRRHWLAETLPVDNNIVRQAKLKLNLMITIPCALLCSILFTLAFRPGVIMGLLYIAIPTGYAFINSLWGLFIGQKYADYSLSSETQILHQSTVFFIGWLPGVVLPLLIGVVLTIL